MRPDPDLCCDCKYYGNPQGWTKHKDKEKITVHECELHPGCMNTMYSVKCSDFIRIREKVAYGQNEPRQRQAW